MLIPRERLIKLTMSPIIMGMMKKRDLFETYEYDNLLASQTLMETICKKIHSHP